ncbi:flagellar hook-associated protein FlgK [Clostridium sp. SYSU_GA19001]|uniref:flagellar hook-associated protein FlgK n=1 Tax=Clostridium caldaquaticum TaxID=2940653 RepID=UPI002076EA3B|nr:flagellar hook-associated protein FlgK [Clostridium caldaquaticum]MCM8710954.1 flagellar hook-associated protein FlgK [Clostridium caldaquaticum]
MSGLFSIFNIASRGMSTQQRAINVTSHNIANANTEGYSRQRAVIQTTRPFGMPTLNNAAEPGQIGTGSQVTAIQRVRDSFLDYQVRVENSRYGQFSARDKFLSEIESIFNEPSDTGISSLIGKFFDSWQTLSQDAENSNSRTIVVQQAAALADALNHTASQLQKLKENTQSVIKNTVFEVNDILNQIDQLNVQIIGVKVAGQEPNDLMDRRDLLLDELSTKFNITIDKKNFEGFDVKPEDLISKGLSDNSSFIKAEDNTNVRRLSYIDSITKNADGTYDITYYKLGDKTSSENGVTIKGVTLTDEEYKQIDETRVIWADKSGNAAVVSGSTFKDFVLFQPSKGELQGYMSVQKDIDTYMDQLNKVAKALAFSVNALHSGKESSVTYKVDANGEFILDENGNKIIESINDFVPFFVNSDVADNVYTIKSTKSVLYDKNGTSALEAVLRAEDNITAANISVNKQLIDDVMQIKTRFNDDKEGYELASDNVTDGLSDGSRALAIAQLRDKLMNIQDIGSVINSRADLFDSSKGNNLINKKSIGTIEFVSSPNGMKIDNYFKDVIDRLGVQGAEAKRMVVNQETLLASFKQTRESISGVSLDEEMANLIQYQHAYQANAKIISTVDELLDVVINGLKR